MESVEIFEVIISCIWYIMQIEVISDFPVIFTLQKSHHFFIQIPGFFFNTFMVAGVVGQYRLLSFEARSLSFSPNAWVFPQGRALSFFQKPWSFEDLELVFLEKMTVFGGKSVRKAPNIAFFGALSFFGLEFFRKC